LFIQLIIIYVGPHSSTSGTLRSWRNHPTRDETLGHFERRPGHGIGPEVPNTTGDCHRKFASRRIQVSFYNKKTPYPTIQPKNDDKLGFEHKTGNAYYVILFYFLCTMQFVCSNKETMTVRSFILEY
jgi:hypothetical protein